MEPVLDASGAPFEGTVRREDSAGVGVRCRLWRGFYVTDLEGAESRLERLRGEFHPRPGDLLVCAYLKCGTHWLHEICHFLLTRQYQQRPPNKENFMLEFTDHQAMEAFPSPRILNCHLPLSLIPEAFAQGANKIILVIRNPKDVAVSLYHHYISIDDYKYRSSFTAFLSGLFEPGTLDGGSYFGHTRGFLSALDAGNLSAAAVHLVEFERLKADPRAEILRLDEFLRRGQPDDGQMAPVSELLLDGICDRVGFEQMRRDRGADMSHLFALSGAASGFYRRGDVGDWKNWFDEAASARMDALVERHLAEFSHLYRPTYEI